LAELNNSMGQSYIENMNSAKNLSDYSLQKQMDYDSSLLGQAKPYIDTASSIVGIGTSLADIYLGFEKLDIAKDQLSMSKEQWAETKEELARVKRTRAINDQRFLASTPATAPQPVTS
jgi:hypothetical protein